MNTINGIDTLALHDVIRTVDESPDLGAAHFSSASEWQDDHRVNSTIRDFAAAGGEHRRPSPHVISTDLPEGLLGKDRGPSPLELAIAALTSCVTTTIVAHAAARGIQLDSLHVGAGGDLDLRGFLNLSDRVRKGYGRIRLQVSVQSELPEKELSEFVDEAIGFSPVLDLFRSGTEVLTELA